MPRFHPLIGAALALGPTVPVVAQDAPPPQTTPTPERIVPPIRYSLPPGEGSQPQAPAPKVVPPKIVVPRATPTPRATATPRSTPRVRATPEPVATPTPRAIPTPEPSPSPAPAPIPAPVTATPTPEALPAPEASPAPVAPAQPEEGGSGIWLLLGGLVIAGGAGALWWRRRVRNEVVVAAAPERVEPAPAPQKPVPPEPAAEPVPAASEPVAPPPAPRPAGEAPQYLTRPAPVPIPAGTITAFKDKPKVADPGYITAFKAPAAPAPVLGVEVQPIRAGVTDDDAGFLEFQFAMLNPGPVAVHDMLVSAWLLAASPDQDRQIAAFLAEPTDPANHNLYALNPGEHREHRATMGAPFDMLHIVEVGGRRFFAPILLVDARYKAAGGAVGRTSAAYMVGRPNPANGKLSPIYVDRGARVVEGLATRPYPIPPR